MVSVAEATRIIHEVAPKTEIREVPVDEAVGLTLAQPIVADRDFPPYDRVAMDGIAVKWNPDAAPAEYFIEHIQAAGQPAYQLKNPNACVEVMTGAVRPEGTDTVIPYENLTIENNVAKLRVATHRLYQHIHRQGSDAAGGRVLISPGTLISAAEVAVMAATGYQTVSAFYIPAVAIVSTGDELVEVNQKPEPHQIRQSNAYTLSAALRKLGIDSVRYHVPDQARAIEQTFHTVFQKHAIVILSGGVSKGKYDLIPDLLTASGITKQFHQVKQKPGKPFWFGRSERHTVFALPGNPVSTFLCYCRYIEPWLKHSLGHAPTTARAQLAEDVSFTPPLTYFLQVNISEENGLCVAHPVPGGGSGDFINLLQATGFLELPADGSDFKKGQRFPLFTFR